MTIKTTVTFRDSSNIHPRYKLPDFTLAVETQVAGMMALSHDKGVHTKALNKAIENQRLYLELKFAPQNRKGFKIGGGQDTWTVIKEPV
jgi:hypothetical protein